MKERPHAKVSADRGFSENLEMMKGQRRCQARIWTPLVALFCAAALMQELPAVAQSRADWYGRSPDYPSYYASGFRATPDGGAFLAGFQEEFQGASKIFSGLVTRLNAAGGIANQILFPGFQPVMDVVPLDSGAVAVGEQYASMVLIRLGPSGERLWVRSFAYYTSGGILRGAIYPHRLLVTSDGGFLVVGTYQSSGNYPWLLRTDGDGNLLWQRFYGDQQGSTSLQGQALSACELAGGGFAVLGEMTEFPGGAIDYRSWIAAITEGGEILWQRRFGPQNPHPRPRILPLADGGVLTTTGSFGRGACFTRWGSGGEILWNRVLSGCSTIFWLAPLPDGFAAGGSLGTDASCNESEDLLVDLDAEGHLRRAGALRWPVHMQAYDGVTHGNEWLILASLFNLSAKGMAVLHLDRDWNGDGACVAVTPRDLSLDDVADTITDRGAQVLRVPCTTSTTSLTAAAAPLQRTRTLCPVISSVTALQNPYRLKIQGYNFNFWMRYVRPSEIRFDGSPAPATVVKSPTLMVAKGDAALKALLPKGRQVCITVESPANPAYTSSCFEYKR